MTRIGKDEYYMKIANVVALRSTCIRHQFGCVIVKNDQIISTGYNGAVKGGRHCIDSECIRDKLNISSGTKIEICNAVHSEQNALLQAGKDAYGGTLYVNGTPCILCSKMIINAGIKRVVIPIGDDYPDRNGIDLLNELRIDIGYSYHSVYNDAVSAIRNVIKDDLFDSESFDNDKREDIVKILKSYF